MKPIQIVCSCGRLISQCGISTSYDFKVQVHGYCGFCSTLVCWQTTIDDLIERCKQIPVPPSHQIVEATPAITEDDRKLLGLAKILWED